MNRVKLSLLTAILIATAFTFSCSKEDLEGLLSTSSSSDGTNQGVNVSSSSSGGGEPFSSSSGRSDILGSCIGSEHGYQVCAEFLSNFIGGVNAAQQACIDESGIWTASSACPEGYSDFEDHSDEGGIVYLYPDIPVEGEDDECEAMKIALAVCNATCYAAAADAMEAGEDFDFNACIATCNSENYNELCE